MQLRRSPLFVLIILCLASINAGAWQAGKKPANPPAKPAAPAMPEPSLVSIAAGALIAVRPAEYPGWEVDRIIDETPDTGWATPERVVSPQVIVIALAEQTLLQTLTFDLAGTDGSQRGAKDVLVEMSDTGPEKGFQKIAQLVLKDKVNNQSFPVQAEVPGRWVRLTVQSNHGAPDYIELMDFRATGKQLTKTPVGNITGTYETNYGNFHVRQDGTSLTGCYEYDYGVLSGGIEGRILKFTWREGSDGSESGPAIMIVTPDGKQLFGWWWHEGGEKAPAGSWNGTKISTDVGTCPHWKGRGATEQLTSELEEFGRARVYGINFDTNSAVIKDESKTTLERIVASLKAKPEWKVTVEGHTDSTGSAARNQALSQERANAVKAYLEANGIGAARLQAVGHGASKPVATNDTELGRSQNRRVELVKQ